MYFFLNTSVFFFLVKYLTIPPALLHGTDNKQSVTSAETHTSTHTNNTTTKTTTTTTI